MIARLGVIALGAAVIVGLAISLHAVSLDADATRLGATHGGRDPARIHAALALYRQADRLSIDHQAQIDSAHLLILTGDRPAGDRVLVRVLRDEPRNAFLWGLLTQSRDRRISAMALRRFYGLVRQPAGPR